MPIVLSILELHKNIWMCWRWKLSGYYEDKWDSMSICCWHVWSTRKVSASILSMCTKNSPWALAQFETAGCMNLKSVHVSFVPHKIRRIIFSTHNFSTLSGKQWIREISWTRIEIHAQLWWRLKRKSNGYYTAAASNYLREHWSKQLKFFFKPRVVSLVKINEHMPFSRKV